MAEACRERHILVVDDNPGDVRLVREAFGSERVDREIETVANGDDALRYLRREGRYAGRPRPDLILLDLNLPGTDGRQVLTEIKADRGLLQIPVVVMSSSSAEDDVAFCYERHANCYIPKAHDFDAWREIIGAIDRFWLDTVMLPTA
ncbi:MAG: response regulator [Armatimonadetes bacterium]|nr:response regulator [Armatimonadota bacterium]